MPSKPIPATITTPTSIEEATERLTDLEGLLMAKGWERAAILATVVRLPGQGNGTKVESHLCTVDQLTALGIPGLRDRATVRLYVQRWLDVNDGKYPRRGVKLRMPTTPWPPVDPSDAGSRATPSSIGKQLTENPALATAAAQALAAGAIAHVEPAATTNLHRATGSKMAHDPMPPPGPAPVRRPSTPQPAFDDVEVDEAYWIDVRKALRLLLDVQVRVSRGVIPPGDVSMMLQILVPATDWDQAAANLIGDPS